MICTWRAKRLRLVGWALSVCLLVCNVPVAAADYSANAVIGTAPSGVAYRTSVERDKIPYEKRVEAIMKRAEADRLNLVLGRAITFDTREQATAYLRSVIGEIPHGRRYGQDLERLQTWFQGPLDKTSNSVLIAIHLVNEFPSRSLSGLIFQLTPDDDKPCPTRPKGGTFLALVPETVVKEGNEALFIASVPEIPLLTDNKMKCGTIVEAW